MIAARLRLVVVASAVCAAQQLRGAQKRERLPSQQKSIVLILENLGDAAIACEHPAVRVGAGRAATISAFAVPARVACGHVSAAVDGDGYGAARVFPEWVDVGDANAVQLELSRAAHKCASSRDAHELGVYDDFEACVFELAYGGLDREAAPRAWRDLWSDEHYWRLCERRRPAAALRTFPSEASPGQDVDVLRETPFVAAARGFLTEAECAAVLSTTPAIANLGRAHVGGGAGKTSFSDARETLSTNLYVDWAADDAPATRVAAKTVELASELLGETIPYEAQEPINFLFYRAGYEYKPHSDGAGGKRGKRVATTLVYCDAPASGGSTVFTGTSGLRFAPKRGDLLFFSYANGARDTTHAACPVGAGNKSTLTMWHRLGVSPDEPWDRFENWGRFDHPHLHSRYRGKPYRERVTDAADL